MSINERERLLIKNADQSFFNDKRYRKNYFRLSESSDFTDYENSPLINKSDPDSSDGNDMYIDSKSDEFNMIVKDVEKAIRKGIDPGRISQGSSGSYFAKNQNNEICAVFKPRDEEPYGVLNPKWGKWFQRNCFPCGFGRTCLIPNHGYLSEAGASIVDRYFNFNIVPDTRVVRLVSNAFNYSRIDRAKSHTKIQIANTFPGMAKKFNRLGLPPKVGSFQLFVKNYKDAYYWMTKFDSESLPEQTYRDFKFQFDKLAALDYIIRNTDRGRDNWLIKYQKPDSDLITNDTGECNFNVSPKIQIAAIDNGLAFPWKHPDEIRNYPFSWTTHSIAKLPFCEEFRQHMLPRIKDYSSIEKLVKEIHRLFSTNKNFSKKFFNSQMAVMRGQILNLRAALESNLSPYQLTEMSHVCVWVATDYELPPEKQAMIAAGPNENIHNLITYTSQDHLTTYPEGRAWFRKI